jgi:GTP-binding protein Era
MEKSMTEASAKACAETDLILFITDAGDPDFESDDFALRRLGLAKRKKVLAINKIDSIKKPVILKMIDHFSQLGGFEQIMPISARTGEGVDTLLDALSSILPEGPKFYPDEMITDQPERFVMGEIIREKVFGLLQQELPYSIAVLVEYVEERDNGMLVIHADIIVERQSQKGMVVGKGGSMVKKIGQAARKDLELRLNSKVYLELRVKVEQKWSRDQRMFEKFGYGSTD